MKILRRFKKIYIKLLFKTSPPSKWAPLFRKYLDVKIGKNVRFTGSPRFGSEPYLIEIGDNVTITQNVSFITHDGGVKMFRKEFPGINVFGKIKIGNNVFIGANSLILPSVVIGDNVVIGAGSIVAKSIPENSVVGGIPAKVIKKLDEYRESTLKKAMYVTESDPEKRKQYILKKI